MWQVFRQNLRVLLKPRLGCRIQQTAKPQRRVHCKSEEIARSAVNVALQKRVHKLGRQ